MDFLLTLRVPFLPPLTTRHWIHSEGTEGHFESRSPTFLSGSGDNFLKAWTGKTIFQKQRSTAAHMFRWFSVFWKIHSNFELFGTTGIGTPSNPSSSHTWQWTRRLVLIYKFSHKSNANSQSWTAAVWVLKASDTWSKSSCTDITDHTLLLI